MIFTLIWHDCIEGSERSPSPKGWFLCTPFGWWGERRA